VESNYIQGVVSAINEAAHSTETALVMAGQNIDSGSRIGGMARGLEPKSADRVMNLGNCELTHCGIGLGMMLDGSYFALFMKQLDFLLLGLDQLVNTFQFIRAHRDAKSFGSFTIYLTVCDQGYQGSQSSFNAIGDVASLTRIPTFCLNGQADIDAVVGREFFGSGIRIAAVSQRQFGMAPLGTKVVDHSDDLAVFHYLMGDDVTIVSFNFALRLATEVADLAERRGCRADVFHHNFVPGPCTDLIEASLLRTGRLLVLDDSKTHLKAADGLIREMTGRIGRIDSLVLSRRDLEPSDFGVTPDTFDVQDVAVTWISTGSI